MKGLELGTPENWGVGESFRPLSQFGEKKSKYLAFLFLSIFLHLSLGVIVFFSVKDLDQSHPVLEPPALPTRMLSEKEFSSLQKFREEPVVTHLDATEKKRPLKDAYLSDQNRSVEKEMMNPFTGIPSKAKSFEDSQSESVLGKKPTGLLAKSETGGIPYLLSKEIASGVQNLLNTEEYKYASFHRRLTDDLYPIWAARVRSRTDPKELDSKEEALTRLEVTTLESGSIEKVDLIRSSGCSSCDEVALSSVLTLTKVLNLPKDLLDPNGRFKFKISFTILKDRRRVYIDVPVEGRNALGPPKFYDPSERARK